MSSIRSASSRTRIGDRVERDQAPVEQVLQAAGRRDEHVRLARALRLLRSGTPP